MLARAFAVLGPAEALCEMAAFVTVLLVSGWALGEHVRHTTLLVASGATYAAVVFGQSANAFACRSATRRVGRVSDRRNPMLRYAVAAQIAIAALLFTPPLAHLLHQAVPSAAGAAVAACAVPAVLGADAAQKWTVRRALRRRPRTDRTGTGVERPTGTRGRDFRPSHHQPAVAHARRTSRG